jgi:hypothetical protein
VGHINERGEENSYKAFFLRCQGFQPAISAYQIGTHRGRVWMTSEHVSSDCVIETASGNLPRLGSRTML